MGPRFTGKLRQCCFRASRSTCHEQHRRTGASRGVAGHLLPDGRRVAVPASAEPTRPRRQQVLASPRAPRAAGSPPRLHDASSSSRSRDRSCRSWRPRSSTRRPTRSRATSRRSTRACRRSAPTSRPTSSSLSCWARSPASRGLISRVLHVPHRVRHRVRPAQPHLRAPVDALVRLLRPRPVRAADLARELRHPQRADVHDVRPAHLGAVLDRRDRVRLHALLQPAARRRRAGDDARPVLGRRAHAQGDVPDLVGHPGTSRRGRDGRRRERERRAGGEGLRTGAGRARQARRRGKARRVGLHQRRRHPRGVHPVGAEPAPDRTRRSSSASAGGS